MDRKPLWSSWSSFSLSHFYPLTPFQSLTHFSPPVSSSSFRSSVHQHRSAFSALAVTQSRCCSTNFSHPFIPAIRPFPKSTLSQRGEAFSHWLLLHGNFSLFCSSFAFFHKSFFRSFHFIFCLSLAVFSPSHYFPPSFLLHSYCPWSVFLSCCPLLYPFKNYYTLRNKTSKNTRPEGLRFSIEPFASGESFFEEMVCQGFF